MYTHRRGTKAYEQNNAWAHVKKIQIGVLNDVFPVFFQCKNCSFFLLISCGFFERKEELSNTCWAMASLQLTVATLEGEEFENSDRSSHTLEFFQVFFRCQIHIHAIFYWYSICCDVICFFCSGCQSGMLLYVQMMCEFLCLSLICLSFWRAACDACPSVIASSEVLQETQHFPHLP